MTGPIEVLDFWLGEIGPEGWYTGGEEIDGQCRDRFLEVWQAANEGHLDHWIDGPAGSLAYLVVTDQFPRNIHRGSPLAFATDIRARAAARRALDEGWDSAVPEPDRQFYYLPFEHSEDIDDQELCVQLIEKRLSSEPLNLLHAQAHREIIRRFGRFPFRNAALGRESSDEERAFLAEGGYGAIVRALTS